MYINNQKLCVRRFSSGECKFIKSTLDGFIDSNKVKILYENEYSFLELLIILNYYKSKNVIIDLILSYLPYQRMDHRDCDELDTVNYIANILNSLNLNSITICEPHCDISNFKNSKKYSLVHNIKDMVFENIGFNESCDIVVLPDKGGVRRYGDIAKNIVYFNKVRDDRTGLIVKHEIVGKIKGCSKVLIIDDIISTGDTIVNIIEELEKNGIEEIYILSGHIEDNQYNERIFNYSSVVRVYSTNSLKKCQNNKLELFNVVDLLM